MVTVSGASPMLSLMRSGSAVAYRNPRSDRSESPPILPSTLNWLSPCWITPQNGSVQMGGRCSARTHSGEEYAARLQVQIHEVKRDAALQVSVYTADGDLIPDVDYFEV